MAAIFESLGRSILAIMAVGAEGKVSFASPAAEALFGRVVGMDLSNPPPSEDPRSPLAAILGIWNSLQEDPPPPAAPRILRAKRGGQPVYLWVEILPLGREGSEGRLVLCSDLTSIVTGAEPVRALVSQLAHDLRNPLTSISGAAELLLSGRVGELVGAQQRLVKIVDDGTQKLATIIRNAYEEGREGGAAE